MRNEQPFWPGLWLAADYTKTGPYFDQQRYNLLLLTRIY